MTSEKNVRVRFAPSPTGYLHVGGLRSLFFNYLYAKKQKGKFILRIEDTDQARSTRQSENMILESITAMGLLADESPALGGPHVPYRQSERLKIYGEHAKALLERDQAYYCFCPEEELSRKREIALKLGKVPQYDGTCAKTPIEEARARLKKGEKAGMRFRAYAKDYSIEDAVKGKVTFPMAAVGDFFITRTPREDESEIAEGIGMPVYNFCCVMDDHLMGITHVIRGDEHLSNTARQLQIYDAFNWEVPVFAHTAIVTGADRQKLSKRNGDSSVQDYLNQGYFPQALLNFLVLLGWSPGSELKTLDGHPEIFSMQEMIDLFNLDGLQKAPAVFDVTKLRWMNSHYFRHLPLEEVEARALPFLAEAVKGKSPEWIRSFVETYRGECAVLPDLLVAGKMQFETSVTVDEDALAWLKGIDVAPVIAAAVELLPTLSEPITAESVDAYQKAVGAKSAAKGKNLFMTLRCLMTGSMHGAELKKSLPLLGREKLIARVTETKSRI
jgi:nondiscriminating glutamyl-tRNA synthetase